MTADDKFGLGAGALAIGLAGAAILWMQFHPDFFGLPHVDKVAMPEAIFDGIVAVVGIPAGLYLFYRALTGNDEK
jgi:hypothetical protein